LAEAAKAATCPPPELDDRHERVACPLCASTEAEPYRTAADIVKCRSCHTVYLRTRLNAAELDRIYQTYVDDGSHLKLPADAAQAAESPWKRSYFLNEIMEIDPARGPMLDVGCSWGAFLLGARAQGFSPMGIELTRKAVRFANKTLGIPVVNTQFLDTPIPAAALQVITMVHVLEHLPQPKQALAKAFDILKPGGLFCGIVPNIESFSSQRQRDSWYWLDPNYHYVHYSPATLRSHLEAAGFVVERLYTTRGDFDQERIRALVPELDSAAFAQFLNELATSGRGEEIRFFARKPAHVPAAVAGNFTLPLQQLDWPTALDPYIEKSDGKFVYLNDGLLEPERLRAALETAGPFYFHCGGAGDALLLLATFYDAHPNSVVVSYPNSQAAMRSFFEAFPALERVYFLPQHSKVAINELMRKTLPQLPNFRGMGVTPRTGYGEEWNEKTDIFRDYGVIARPQWAQRCPGAAVGRRVVVAPQGSLVGMAGTKRNVVEPADWPVLLDFLKQQGYQPVVLGTPNERETYPCPDGCEDRRSFSFLEQMEQILSCALFVGADSWAKTFSALAGLPTYVFDAIKGGDWRGIKDPSDFVFLDSWDCLQVVSGLDALKDCLTRDQRHARPPAPETGSSRTAHVAWEGGFTDHGSLSHVNRELTCALGRQPKVEVARIGAGHRTQAPARTEITVRHAWPPSWQSPKRGHWVLIQPWEYGALPLDWTARLEAVEEIWVPSEYVRRVYVDSGVRPAKVHVVPNGIDPERFRPGLKPLKLATTKSFKFLFVGGTIHRKGPDLLLKAFLESFTFVDDVCLVIKDFGGQDVYAGQTLQEEIRAAQAVPNAPEILYLTGDLSEEAMPSLYAACDCLVHPYRGEGFALPVLEAMACGLPVLVTAGGATDDFVTEQCGYRIAATRRRIGYRAGPFSLARPGWLLEPSLDDLKQRMRHVFEHRDEARARGQAASEIARRDWTWDRAAQVAAQRIRTLVARESVKLARKSVAIELPPAGRLGDLSEAREFFRQKRYRDAWDAVVAAMQVRPFHPEARELIKEIGRKEPALGPAPNQSGTPRLSVCLIAKNEERFLARCLQSVRGVAWQIVVVDTGSTDATKEIAQQHGAEVYDFPWCDDFSAARNAALEHVRGDWVLVLDADEELTAEGRESLQREMRADNVLAYRLPIVDVGKEDEGCSYVPRLFRNAPGLFFVGRIHEQVFSSVEVRRRQWGMENRLGSATLLHHGYAAEVVAERSKLARNLRLLERALDEMPNEPNLLMNYGLELSRAGRQEMAVEKYVQAFRVMQSMPEDQIAPELRESLLTQLSTQLAGMKKLDELIRLMHSPLAQRGGLTASLHFGLGLAYMQLKRFEEAAEEFQQCLTKRDEPSLTPVNRDIRKAAPHHCLAICLIELKQLDAAAEAFQQALAADPQSRHVRFDYAVFQHGRGLPLEALKTLYALAAEKPDALPVWLLGSHIALSDPQFLEFAREWTGEAIKLFPEDQMTLLHRAEVLMLSGRPKEALPLWRKAGGSQNAVHRAARILCELATGECVGAVDPNLEAAASGEFIKWYQRLLKQGMGPVLTAVNERLGPLSESLPSAARTLEMAIAHAQADSVSEGRPVAV
jgi:glycosyltransferase involved in cell wall biosynthesis/tetratricopeptide (TPR) repeat protein/SAM-dependent methyltransferase